MKLYHYHPNTLEYLGSSEARLDPVGGEPLVPKNATPTPPPSTQDREAAVFDGEAWAVVPDNRGIYYLPDKTEQVIELLGQPAPAEYAVSPPPKDSVYDGAGGWRPMTAEELSPPEPPEVIESRRIRAILIESDSRITALIPKATPENRARLESMYQLRMLTLVRKAIAGTLTPAETARLNTIEQGLQQIEAIRQAAEDAIDAGTAPDAIVWP